MRLLIGATVPVDLRAALEPVAARLGAPDLAPVHPDVTALAGVPDPLVLAEAPGPIVAIPVDDPGRAPAAAVVAHADAIALLDPDDIPAEAGRLPLVVVGLPAPPARGGGVALDHSGVPRAVVEALRVEAMRPELVAQAHGVTWLRGRGAAVLARAAGAWRSGRAAIGLPGVPDAERLRAAGCPRCTSTLQAVELTRLLLDAPPLARALAARGRVAADAMPSAEAVALALLEAAEVATVERRPARGSGRGEALLSSGSRRAVRSAP